MFRPISDFCLQALEYAQGYVAMLKVATPVKTTRDLPSWDLENFQQRVRHFHWNHLPSVQQHQHMTHKLLKLLKLVQSVWGGELEKLETEYKITVIQSYLVAIIERLSQCHTQAAKPLGSFS